jgi:hypothetical protein
LSTTVTKHSTGTDLWSPEIVCPWYCVTLVTDCRARTFWTWTSIRRPPDLTGSEMAWARIVYGFIMEADSM